MALFEQCPFGFAVGLLGFIRRVADGSEADPAKLGERAHHVEDDTPLAGLVEVEVPANDDVEEVVVREPRELVRLQAGVES